MNISQKKPLWLPSNEESTNIAKFMKYVNKKHCLQIRTYDDLWRWSVHSDSLGDFWRDAYLFLGISPFPSEANVGPAFQRQNNVSLPLFPPPTFFQTETFNLAEFILCNRDDKKIAIQFACEGRPGIESITWATLLSCTREAYDAMVSSGIKTGDKVAVVMSNSVNTIVLCLATLAIGAVWSSASPELGSKAIVDRYDQIKPKIIFADDAYVYAGKTILLENRILSWSNSLTNQNKELQNVVVVPYCGVPVKISHISKGVYWESFLCHGTGKDILFSRLPFSHPAFILFSSGTTGIPKCILHSAGGVALKVNTDSRLQHDIQPGDVFFQYTTTAWIMWVINFVNLSTGASMMLYDGSPFHPRPGVLLQLAEELGVTVFGTSPRYLSELRSRNIVPRNQYKIDKLRIVTSTGSVLTEDLYQWFYQHGFPQKSQLVSMSGGTDIAGCFVGGCPILPVYSGEIQAKCLGMRIEVFDASKPKPVSIEHLGQPGELYRSSYFSRFGDRVWCQGDFIQVLPGTKGILMMGRSDGVLNPSGVRFGSAEIYAVVDTVLEISDSICVGQRRKFDNDEIVLLFVKMKPPHRLLPKLVVAIKTAIKERYSIRHVPAHIFEVPDIPYTINGKKCEINVKQIVSGLDTKVSGTVAYPESLKAYEQYLQLPRTGEAKL